MKKIALFCVAMLLAGSMPVSAQTFKDVPEDHWAASAVYDLVKLGVTKGYPDGTFRGKKNITRFETAIFLSKLAKAISTTDLKDELREIRSEIAALKKPAKAAFSGSFLASWKLGNLLGEAGGTRGVIASYRLKLLSQQELGKGSNVVINLDTMDYGYLDDYSSFSGGALATQLLDIESNIKMDLSIIGIEKPVDLKLTYGPGPKVHTWDSSYCLPSEKDVTYIRPYTGVIAATTLAGTKLSGGYIARGHQTTGKVTTSQITGSLGWNFEGVPLINSLKVDVTGDYISEGILSPEKHDQRAKLEMAAPLGDKVHASGTMAFGGSEQKNWMAAGELILNDIWDTGTVANIRFAKVGSEFMDDRFASQEFDLAGYDYFNRPLIEGTANLGGKLVQNVSDDIKLIGKGDLRLSGDYRYDDTTVGRFTAEGGISYTIALNTTLDVMYRVHQDKSTGDTSDIAAFGLLYQF